MEVSHFMQSFSLKSTLGLGTAEQEKLPGSGVLELGKGLVSHWIIYDVKF